MARDCQEWRKIALEPRFHWTVVSEEEEELY